jgi:hypothetical protein
MGMIRLLPVLALLLSACGGAATVSTTTTEPPPPDPDAESVVLIAELTGGCAMMGPNCERFVVFGDGTVEAYRAGENAALPVDIGSIDPDLVATLHNTLHTTDLQALRIRLPPGECQGCVDGIDTLATFTIDGRDVTFSTIETDLTPTESVFAAMWAVIDSSLSATEIPLIAR